MGKKKLQQILTIPSEGTRMKLLPNYDRKGKRLKDFINMFYMEFDMDDYRHIIFNSEEHPMTEELKMDLYMATYLNQLCLCNGFVIDEDGKKKFTIFMLSEDMVKKYAETSGPYYDLIDFPPVEVTQTGNIKYNPNNIMTFELFDAEKNNGCLDYFDDDEEMVDFISTREYIIDEILEEYKWINYEKELTQLFKEDKRLYKHRNYFRIHKINEILGE